MEMIFVFFAVLFGLVWGSFLNVLSQRPRNKKKSERTLMGRSFCDSCKHQLSPVDLVPVLSYILLRGSCRYCKKNIPIRNLFVELVTGVFFALFAVFAYSQDFSTAFDYLQIFIIGGFFLIFSYLVSYDIWWLEIPLVPTLIALFLGVLYKGVFVVNNSDYSIVFLLYSLSPVIFMILINLFYHQQAFGVGDYLVIFSLSLFLDTKQLFISIETAILSAAVLGVLYAVKIGKLKGVQVPLVPFLTFGWLIALAFSNQIMDIILPKV